MLAQGLAPHRLCAGTEPQLPTRASNVRRDLTGKVMFKLITEAPGNHVVGVGGWGEDTFLYPQGSFS